MLTCVITLSWFNCTDLNWFTRDLMNHRPPRHEILSDEGHILFCRFSKPFFLFLQVEKQSFTFVKLQFYSSLFLPFFSIQQQFALIRPCISSLLDSYLHISSFFSNGRKGGSAALRFVELLVISLQVNSQSCDLHTPAP